MIFSIIIPAHNEEEKIGQCLEALLQLDYPDKEIIVVDDASTDNTSAVVRKFLSAGVKLIRKDQPGGISQASNEGLKAARGDIIVRTDADTVVCPDWLKRFSRFFEDPRVVAVGGSYQCLNKDSFFASCTAAIDAVFSNLLKRRFLLTPLRGANRAIRSSALKRINNFDESFSDSEDIKIFNDLRKIGKIVFDPTIIVATCYPRSLLELWRRHFGWGYAVGRVRLCLGAFKAVARPIFVYGFYAALLAGGLLFYTNSSFVIVPLTALIIYFLFFVALAALGFKIAEKKAAALLMPFVFLFQNTAYCQGMISGLISTLVKGKRK